MFNNAQNTNINGGNFNIMQGNAPRTALDILRNHCALGALLDSDERFDPPRCAEETREAIIKEITDWVDGGNDTASLLWLLGAAGAGKSAIAQTTAEICQRMGRHASSFFFSRTSASTDRSNGNHLVPTLVLQLVKAIPEIKTHVENVINQDPLLFSKSRRTQMEELFTTPLRLAFVEQPKPEPGPEAPAPNPKERRPSRISRILRWFTRRTKRKAMKLAVPPQTPAPSAPKVLPKVRLVVIDGLDECNDSEVQCDILRILASSLPLLPLPIRFLVASRPESHIVRIFNHNPDFQSRNLVRRVDLGLDADADDNIRVFLHMKFREIRRTHPLREYLDPSWPSEDAIQTLVQKSSTQFIYPSTVMKYVQHHRGRPDERLEIILGLSVAPAKDRPFAQLDALYIFIFSTTDPDEVETIQRIFGILYLKTQKQFSYLETSPAMIEEYISLKSGNVTLLLDNFLSLVALPSNHQTIRIFHASLFDFLLNPSRSGDSHLDIGFAHERLALYHISSPRQWVGATTPERIFRVLLHTRNAWISPQLRYDLSSFSDLYIFLGAFKTSAMSNDLLAWIPILVTKFLDVLSRQPTLSDGLNRDLFDHHVEKIAQSLESISNRRETGSSQNDENLVMDRSTEQCWDSIYESLVAMFFPSLPDTSNEALDVLNKVAFEHRHEDDVEDIMKHIFIAAFEKIRDSPFAVFKTLKLFSWLRRYITLENEVNKAFRKVLLSYLKIIQASFDPHEVYNAMIDWQIGQNLKLLDEIQ